MPEPSTAAVPLRAAARAWPGVSVVMPVLNEERHLAEAVAQVLAQDYPGELELVMALGPSRDHTDEVAAALVEAHPQVRSVRNPTGSTPAALNAAVAEAAYPVVVRVDGHALFPTDYVRTAVEVLQETGADNVGGVMAAEGVTPFEQAVARAMTSRFGVGNAGWHTGGEAGPSDTVYLGTFRREALDRVGGYDESYLRAQDWEMNLRIRQTGGLVWFTPRLRVAYRPRPDVRSLARQYRDYGRWRRVVMRRNPGSSGARYLAPPAALVAVGAGTVLGLVGLVTGQSRLAAAGFAVPAAYGLGVLAASVASGRDLPPGVLARLPVVFATMHGAWAVGFVTSPRALALGNQDAALRSGTIDPSAGPIDPGRRSHRPQRKTDTL